MSLIDKKNEAIAQLEGIVAKAKTENRSFTAEERSSFDKIDAEIKTLGEDIAREARSAEHRKNVETVVEQRVLPAVGAKKDDTLTQFRDHVLRGLEARDLATGNGVLVPNTIDAALRAVVKALPGIEAEAGVKVIRGFESYPIFGDASAAWIAEGDSITPGDVSTGSISLKPFALAAIGKISDRLSAATNEDFVTDFVDAFGEAIYLSQETAYWSGSGVNQPEGLMTATGVGSAIKSGSVSVTSGSVVVKQLADLTYKMSPEFRSGAVFVVCNAFLGALAGMVDTSGRPLNIVTFVNNVPYINGIKVVVSPVAVAATDGNTVGALVNLKQYRIGAFGNAAYTYKRLGELYAASLNSGHLVTTFKDARLGRAKGIVRIVAAA